VIRACKALGCNIVYSTSSDFANVIPAYFASKFCKIPFVIVFHSFPSESSSIIMKNPKSLLKNILQRGHTLDFIMNFLRYRAFLNADEAECIFQELFLSFSFPPSDALKMIHDLGMVPAVDPRNLITMYLVV